MEIITLYTCDEWRSTASMRPYWIGTNINKFFKAVRKGIEEGVFSYGERHRPEHLMLEEFDEDLKQCKTTLWDNLFNQTKLTYGHVTLNKNNSYC